MEEELLRGSCACIAMQSSLLSVPYGPPSTLCSWSHLGQCTHDQTRHTARAPPLDQLVGRWLAQRVRQVLRCSGLV